MRGIRKIVSWTFGNILTIAIAIALVGSYVILEPLFSHDGLGGCNFVTYTTHEVVGVSDDNEGLKVLAWWFVGFVEDFYDRYSVVVNPPVNITLGKFVIRISWCWHNICDHHDALVYYEDKLVAWYVCVVKDDCHMDCVMNVTDPDLFMKFNSRFVKPLWG